MRPGITGASAVCPIFLSDLDAGIEETVPHGEHGCGTAGRNPDLGVDMLDVAAHRADRHRQPLSHFFVGKTAGHEDQDFGLAG